MSLSRRNFLELIGTSFPLLLILSTDLISSCTWNKRKDKEIAPQINEEPTEPYIPPPGKSLVLKMEETVLIAGEEIDIQWEQTGLTTLNLYFSSDAGTTWSEVAKDLGAETAPHLWTVPAQPSSFCLLKITNAEDEQMKSQTEVPFRIKTITVLDMLLYPSLQSVGGSEVITLFNITTIIIRKTAADFLALSMHCTHNGCIINYEGSPGFNCSCHGSLFNAEGEVLQGPAQRALPKYDCSYNAVQKELTIIV